jgi:hypothetical protein
MKGPRAVGILPQASEAWHAMHAHAWTCMAMGMGLAGSAWVLTLPLVAVV